MKQAYKQRFARIVQKWLDESNQSQRQAAVKIQCSQSTLGAWLRAQSSPFGDVDVQERLAEELKLTPEELLADVRGVGLQKMPKKLGYTDIEFLVLSMPKSDQAALLSTVAKSLTNVEMVNNGYA